LINPGQPAALQTLEVSFMNLSGKVTDEKGNWAVNAETHESGGGFSCEIHMTIHSEAGEFAHEYKAERTFDTEQDAVLYGLREGMVWIDLKMSRTIRV
jgi:hypothetical protein